MSKYDETTQKKKEAVIKAALSLFKEKGCSRVGMNEIAVQAKVSQASIYNYFGSKDALVVECAKNIMSNAFTQAYTILEMDIPFNRKLEMVLSTCDTKVSQSISAYFTKEALQDTALIQLFTKAIEPEKKKIYTKYIQLGKKEKVIDSNVPTEMYLKFIDSIHSWGQESSFYDDLEKNTQYAYQLLLYGLIGRG